MGYQVKSFTGNEIERYAWFPVRTASKKWVWLKKYYAIVRYVNSETVRYPTAVRRLTEQEYTMYLLTKPEPGRPAPPSTTRPIIPANIPRQKPLTRG